MAKLAQAHAADGDITVSKEEHEDEMQLPTHLWVVCDAAHARAGGQDRLVSAGGHFVHRVAHVLHRAADVLPHRGHRSLHLRMRLTR